MEVDLASITNRVNIFLFSKNLCTNNIRRVTRANAINTLADAFTLAHHNLLKVKKYEELLYNEEHEPGKINHIVASSKGASGNGEVNQSNRGVLNKTNKIYTYLGTC